MQQQLDALFAEQCESNVRFCEANDLYYEILTETRLDEPNDGVRRRKWRKKKGIVGRGISARVPVANRGLSDVDQFLLQQVDNRDCVE